MSVARITDEVDQAFCANILLQVTNVQGLGTRLGLTLAHPNEEYALVGEMHLRKY